MMNYISTTATHIDNDFKSKNYNIMLHRNAPISYIKCEVVEDIANIINSIEDLFIHKIDEVLVGDAIANVVDKWNNLLTNIIVRIVDWLKPVASFHNVVSKEDAVIRLIKILGVSIQRFQSSLEDALSSISLLMGLLSTLSLILILTFFI